MSKVCSICNAPSVILRPYSGEVLCEQCFSDSIVGAVRTAISKFQMLERTDRIAVAYSGGKDSTVLLAILVEIQERFPESEVIAITLQEGSDLDHERQSVLSKVTRRLNVEHVTSSYQDLFSLTLDEIANHALATQSSISPCAYCGTLRRQGLNILARNLNATKLALGHNLDDEVQSMLMNLIRGDLPRLARIAPILKGIPGWLVPRIKPLYHLLEADIRLYSDLLGLPVYHPPCPYKETSLRSEIRGWLNSFEDQHPGSKYNLHATFMKIIATLPTDKDKPYQKCRICNEITSQEVCAVCLYRQGLGITSKKQ